MLLYADVFVDYESGVIATATTGDVCEIHAAGDYDAEFLEGVTAYMLRAGARKCKMRIRALVHPRQQSAAFAVFRYVGIEIADTLFGGKPENIILLERLSPEQSAPEIPDTVAPEDMADGLRRDSATGWFDVLRQWWTRTYAWVRGL